MSLSSHESTQNGCLATDTSARLLHVVSSSSGSDTEEECSMLSAPRPGKRRQSASPATGETSHKIAKPDNDVIDCDDRAAAIDNTSNAMFLKPTLRKIVSLQSDAEKIAEMFDNESVETVYRRLKRYRNHPNRVDIVSNEIIEGVEEVQEDESNEVTVIDDTMTSLKEVEEYLREFGFSKPPDPNAIYGLLEKYRDKDNCVKYVLEAIMGVTLYVYNGKLFKNSAFVSAADNSQPQSSQPSLLDDLMVVMKSFPTENPNRVYDMLERAIDSSKRVVDVIAKLNAKEQSTTSSATETIIIDDNDSERDARSNDDSRDSVEIVANTSETTEKETPEKDFYKRYKTDPLYKDTEHISKVFPLIPKAEIYAYLEAHHANPKRVLVVTEELLHVTKRDDAAVTTAKSESDHKIPVNVTIKRNDEAPDVVQIEDDVPKELDDASNIASALGPDHSIMLKLEKDVEAMKPLFTDCDPMYLYDTLSKMTNDPDRVTTLTNQMYEQKNYPKLKERLEREKREQRKQRLLNMQFNMDDFLAMFPDPEAEFKGEVKDPVSASYQDHARKYLLFQFPTLHARRIDEVLVAKRHRFTLSFEQLQEDMTEYAAFVERRMNARNRRATKSKKFRITARNVGEPMPDEPDEFFYRELLYVRHQQEIQTYLEQKKVQREERFLKAKELGDLKLCSCCYDDEVLPEDMLSCGQGHAFCKECIRRSAEVLIGQAKVVFPCLSSENCEETFHTNVLQQVLTNKSFTLLLRRRQEEEIRQADIEGLVTCPFCPYATVMDEDDKVFKCLNPDCLKESCRLCNEPNHIPLRCNEVEKQGETDMRTYIERRMTEAMIRICYRCKKRFYKTEGCNKMTCTCGATMCYVCKEPIHGYDHFGPNGCPQDTDINELHRQEMEKAGIDAKSQYINEHPTASAQMKHDPLKELRKQPTTRIRQPWWPTMDHGIQNIMFRHRPPIALPWIRPPQQPPFWQAAGELIQPPFAFLQNDYYGDEGESDNEDEAFEDDDSDIEEEPLPGPKHTRWY